MFTNYLVVSLRNLRKHLSYSIVNAAGLALGLATCLLLVIWISHELSYDKFHKNAEDIYRVSMEYSFGGRVARPSVSPTALLPALLNFPEAKTGVRVYNPSLRTPYIVRRGTRVFEETRLYFADSTFFDVFTFPVMRGNPKKVLTDPHSLVVTERMSAKYFGEEDPLGKVLTINDGIEYKVTGVIADPPPNSLLQFDFIASFHSLSAGKGEPTWWSANYQTFVVVNEGSDVTALREKTNAVVKEAVGKELTGENDYVVYNFMPLTDIYLRSDLDEFEIVGDIRYVWIFSCVAALILGIACINYVNLATARAAGRAKEVGIRKVSGALRHQLFRQFIGESLLMTVISFALALFLAATTMPFFNSLTGKNFSASSLFQPSFLLLSLAGLVIVAVAAGAYPAVALTGFNPVTVLKGSFKTSGRGIWLRQTLVVVQFAISAVLITSTLVVISQLNFIKDKKLGFDRENTLVVPLDKKTEEVFSALRTELKRSGAAISVSAGSESPANIKAGYAVNTTDRQGPGVVTAGLIADEEYVPTLGLEIIEGRNFTEEDLRRRSEDTVHTYIVNTAALEALYIPLEEAVGTKISLMGRVGEIIGVVHDFHFSSFHNPIGPLVIFPQREQFEKIFIKLPPGGVKDRVRAVEEIYTSLVTHRPFEFDFLDEQYMSLYLAEERVGKVAIIFAGLAIIIACLGLFGLVAFSAEQKKKEIGIRKVLGADPRGIVLLITRDFSRLVLIALIVGLPVAYWLIRDYWLSGFAYRVPLGIGPFAAGGLACIVVAFGTTAYQAIKASMIDPAEILRNE